MGAASPPSPCSCEDFTAASGEVLYRFVSCDGVGAPPCALASGDVIPAEQQRLPAEALAACPGLVVSHDVRPVAHVQCGAWSTDGGAAPALAWLEENGW